jgi:hypothetical protein
MKSPLQLQVIRRLMSPLAVGVLLSTLVLSAAAQPLEVRRGDLVLRSSTVSSEQIASAAAARHGIEPASNRAVLNVVLMRGKEQQTVPAEVTASIRNLAGVRQSVDMREVRENERVSYIGTYEFLPREVVDVEIQARPLRPAKSRPLTLSYRERMWQR